MDVGWWTKRVSDAGLTELMDGRVDMSTRPAISNTPGTPQYVRVANQPLHALFFHPLPSPTLPDHPRHPQPHQLMPLGLWNEPFTHYPQQRARERECHSRLSLSEPPALSASLPGSGCSHHLPVTHRLSRNLAHLPRHKNC
ncbi:hypothetical protein Pmani_025864 [Petrolisthes manimaculis]|uniref:Uncharacterized protein n=1 Tax=Petrolisthes manimaculis TaxID=1843537 RepID=A0AAE1TX86_9EUCA|nr:hypothetical protein Pmani_025864 [Petrolisthes manimaculis]